MEEHKNTPLERWTEDMVSSWLASIGIKNKYIKTLHEQEVDGQVLLKITEEFLKKETGMKSGHAFLIIESRNELVEKVQKQQNSQTEEQIKLEAVPKKIKRESKPRPFGKPGIDYTYTKHDVLQPETGVIDLIAPCHEYKSFNTAATLDSQRLKAKLANEVFKFATGCMNMRSNGTIHLGVMDSKGDSVYVHGEIIGIPIREKDVYTDALDYIEKCFKSSSEVIRQCIKPPEFILVIDPNSKEQHHVVEFDIEPSESLVRGKVFSVCLPKFKEESNKCILENETTYQRVGAKTEPVKSLQVFYQGVQSRDAQREAAEKSQVTSQECCQDLERKLLMLLTSGKKQIEEEKLYILVTNRFSKEDLQHTDILLKMKLFCVFDFDPDSMVSGLCNEYNKIHKVNLHFMQNYRISSGKSIRELVSHLHLFNQTSWIFCNGRNDFAGNEAPCDENTWCKTKRTFLKDCVSLICKDILPQGTFTVIFLLTSPVETPLLKTFDEFSLTCKAMKKLYAFQNQKGTF
ncbi:sterile alpha motif domain-containing protein 9-like [Silurus meridionalis]|uniref:sterile alpha motif domain-containing protein 9-like n=1 Tax=Silurus meridionalis TaxID=175797 RepID=UPI001EEC0FB7|nr:sterile alpha motif domain-containing protein 9-like [Silurus meridionalis]